MLPGLPGRSVNLSDAGRINYSWAAGRSGGSLGLLWRMSHAESSLEWSESSPGGTAGRRSAYQSVRRTDAGGRPWPCRADGAGIGAAIECALRSGEVSATGGDRGYDGGG